jgi:NAD(P)-dependent dehydrogenase (short-subunit alcohol dehydrogenase family)
MGSPRTALVTGAGSGIGAATAKLLHADGWNLVLWDLALDETASNDRSLIASVDVTDTDAVAAAVASIPGGLDAVVHCAGVLKTGMFDDVGPDWHRRHVDVNLWGTINVVHHVLPRLRQSNGMLVLMGSASGFYGAPEYASYGATKAGVLSLAQALRIELDGSGVDIAVCNPVFVSGPMIEKQETTPKFVRSEGVPFTPEDIALLITRAIERRGPFNIVPKWASKRIWIGSRYTAFAAHRILLRAWRRANR